MTPKKKTSKKKQPSGRMLLRMPKSTHRRLKRKAQRGGVSMNEYIVSMLTVGELLCAMEEQKEKKQ